MRTRLTDEEKVIRYRESHAKYREKNKALLAEKNAARYAVNKDHIKAEMAAYRAANPAFDRDRKKAWKENNPEKVKLYKKNHKYRKKASGSLSHGLVGLLLRLQKGKCAGCHSDIKSGFHRDHIVALAVGGLNIDANIQLLCPPCNQRKGIKHQAEFMRSFGYLI